MRRRVHVRARLFLPDGQPRRIGFLRDRELRHDQLRPELSLRRLGQERLRLSIVVTIASRPFALGVLAKRAALTIGDRASRTELALSGQKIVRAT